MDENEVPDWIEAEYEVGREPLLEGPVDAAEFWWSEEDEPPSSYIYPEPPSYPETWRPNTVGESLIGVIRAHRVVKSNSGKSLPLVEVEDERVGPRTVYCGTFTLREKLFDAVLAGDTVRIVYVGDRVSAMGRPYKAYDIFVTP